ncbi:hypothetical protein CIPAW_07G033500 [Carya illinoinensis]|uniref:GDSL esterase/lipase n=1 Tax=Carya illinoinensis TaxID=32201 RepID=A0A8T1PX66_CARIL|nr:hypothetical protein CIPAW_07G033500 [Carya illinoinensis]KAG6702421.1 hypothetical protein I3842_07G033800 [Carya illinoinensis]
MSGQSLNAGFLSPYLDSLGGAKFTNGPNFAVVGSSSLPRYVPFSLNIQIVMQFLRFKARSIELVTAGSGNMIDDEAFRNALYVIDMGQNDLADSFSKNFSYAQVVKRIPSVLREIQNAVKTLYNEGGRNFWMHSTGPLGCPPQTSYNSAARLFNEGLCRLCLDTRSDVKGANIVYVDVYAIKYDLFASSTKYGFSTPLMACCRYGGPPYNYINIKLTWSTRLSAYSTPRTLFDFFCSG